MSAGWKVDISRLKRLEKFGSLQPQMKTVLRTEYSVVRVVVTTPYLVPRFLIHVCTPYVRRFPGRQKGGRRVAGYEEVLPSSVLTVKQASRREVEGEESRSTSYDYGNMEMCWDYGVNGLLLSVLLYRCGCTSVVG